MDDFLKLTTSLNWQTIISMFIIGWYFTRDIKATLVKLENDVREQGKRTDKLYEIWCDTQKEMSEVRAISDKKFYDLLKEGRK